MAEEEIPARPDRYFLPDHLEINSWEDVSPYFEQLESRNIEDFDSLWSWLRDRSELEAVLEEDLAWRYIKMNIDTRDEAASKSFHGFIENIEPKISPYQNKFDKIFLEHHYDQVKSDLGLNIIYTKADIHNKIFREENIPLNTKLQVKSQEYGAISSEMSIEFEGKELTMPRAGVFLKDVDRNKRAMVYNLIQKRRLLDKHKINDLFNELISTRHKVAKNAGFENYRDYKFDDLCRIDYTVEDCKKFHHSIAEEVMPIIVSIDQKKKEILGIDALKPWDTQVDVSGKPALVPFKDSKELIHKTIQCFNEIDPYFGKCIETMSKMGHLDLESKEGKAPGGFNYPLYEIGVPFIYMNAAGTIRDMVTMVHEGGHAIHSFLSRDLQLTAYKDVTSEVAELASMSMELISMEHWSHFFNDEEALNRAKKEQLEQVIETLPWVAHIDKFQHWIYENPSHSAKERTDYWNKLMVEFGSPVVDWLDLEEEKSNLWQKQLHLFEVPFYYVEYGMAQLGAIAMWKSYKENPKRAIESYKKALSLGYTKSIGEIYRTAGISFDFSQGYVRELMQFVQTELDKL